MKIAEGFGAVGIAVKSPEDLLPALDKAKTISGPVLIEIPIDYKDNLSRLLLQD